MKNRLFENAGGNQFKLVKENNLSPKSNELVKRWIEEKGVRGAAVKMIDNIIAKYLGGLTTADLADTAIFADGLDSMEPHLESGDYKTALQIAVDTAKEMIEDEGGAGIF